MTDEKKAKKPANKKYTALKNLSVKQGEQIKKGEEFTCTDAQAAKFKKVKAI